MPLTSRRKVICNEYEAFQALSNVAALTALTGAPPAAIAPVAENWLAPVNAKKQKKQFCSAVNPETPPAAAKATPLAPTVSDTLDESRRI